MCRVSVPKLILNHTLFRMRVIYCEACHEATVSLTRLVSQPYQLLGTCPTETYVTELNLFFYYKKDNIFTIYLLLKKIIFTKHAKALPVT